MKRPALKEHQVQAISFALKYPYSILALDPRLGKAQPNNCLVYTPDGPKIIGELRAGDYVLGLDGRPKKILGVYPKGKRKIFKVSFNDRSFTRCCLEHLWTVQTGNQRRRKQGYKVMRLDDIRKSLHESDGRGRWIIPHLQNPAAFNKSCLEIHPYVLGVLIGDGSLRKFSTTITNSSDFIFNKLQRNIKKPLEIKRRRVGNTYVISIVTPPGRLNPLSVELRRLRLDVKSKLKFIPDIYKYGATEDRIELLHGLMDTDGYIAADGTTQFSTASEKLCDDVRELVHGLGGIARKSFKRAKCQTGVFDSWTLTIALPNGIKPATKPFKIHRAKDRLKHHPRRRICRIDYAGVCDTTCISVEGDHYLTDDFIVTHNTRSAIEIREKLQNNCLVICPGYLVDNWVKEIRKWVGASAQVTAFHAGKELYEVCDTDYAILSYDLVQKAPHLFEWADMVVADEAHHLKSMKAKRTQFFHKNIYENSVKRMYLLTGSPIKNRVQEYYSLLALTFYNPAAPDTQFLDLYPSEIDFADHFSYREEYTMEINNRFVTIVKWNGTKNIPELKEILKGRYLRIKASDVMDSPPVVYTSVSVSDSPNLKLLDAFNKHFQGDDSSSINPTAKVEAALQKVPFTVKYVKDLLEQVDCLLVYSDHVASAEAIAAQFGVKAITGKVPAAVRSKMADAFQAGEGKILVCTIGSMKEGKDLYRARHIVLNDYCWVPGDLKQVIYRIQMMGQKHHCTVHRMVGSPQDEYIMDALESKVKDIEKVT